MKPKISVLLPAMQGFESVLAAVDAWGAQTRRDQLEVLILCPGHAGPTPAQAAALPPGHFIVPVGKADLHEARALGIQRAAAEFAMLAEDHCLPDPDWAEAILDRLAEGWDVVGPALRPGNRTGVWPEASFVLGYGEWMTPVAGGPAKVLSGWNGTVRTEQLRQFGSELPGALLLGAFLIRRLRRQGQSLYLEDRARMRHFDPSRCVKAISDAILVGTSFGAFRTRHWPLLARILYPLAIPAVAFLHWKRALKHYYRAGSQSGVRPMSLGAAFVLAWFWAFGEAAGSWLGIARITPYLKYGEVKPVCREDVARSTTQERASVFMNVYSGESDHDPNRITPSLPTQ